MCNNKSCLLQLLFPTTYNRFANIKLNRRGVFIGDSLAKFTLTLVATNQVNFFFK